ncbi:hypothetical protein FOL46_006115 [Perkinsus olseni]|uniref:Sorl1p n=1 Tax=Perkinsus olseni TaxID=32597 RepID=A0A7J6LMM9_PEROL|nr:hypothetical protein FOL46_006115 [Perkinsus olseni]
MSFVTVVTAAFLTRTHGAGCPACASSYGFLSLRERAEEMVPRHRLRRFSETADKKNIRRVAPLLVRSSFVPTFVGRCCLSQQHHHHHQGASPICPSILDSVAEFCRRELEGCQEGYCPSSDDVPPGTYIWDSVPPELELKAAIMVVVYEFGSASAHFNLFDKSEKSEPFHSEFYQLKARSFTEDLFDYGVGKCYYFSLHNIGKKIWRGLSVGGGAVRKHALLCTKDPSTSDNPELVLYLDAVRGRQKRYEKLHIPINLIFRGIQNIKVASAFPLGPQGSGDGPCTSKVLSRGCESIKNGKYLNTSAILQLETGADGKQYATLTSNDGGDRFLPLTSVPVVPAEDYSTTGCCELGKTRIFICPTGADYLLLRAPGVELEMVYAGTNAFESELS